MLFRRVLVGNFLAFDRHMNIVLGDTEEFRKIKSKKGSGISEEKEEKRALGLIILRGDSVVSMTIEGPPPPEDGERLTPGGPGVAKPISRPITMGAAPGLAGAVRGIGGPAMSMMQPAMHGMYLCLPFTSYSHCFSLVAAQAGALPPRPLIPGMLPPGVMPPRPMMPPGMVPGMPAPPGMVPGMLPPPRGPPGMLPPRGPPGMVPPPPPSF